MILFKNFGLAGILVTALTLSSCDRGTAKNQEGGSVDSSAVAKQEVVDHYATIVHAVYADSLSAAKEMQAAIHRLLAEPSAKTMAEARMAWTAARLPYLQSEAFRFYEGPIDDEDGPEGLLNAWPMDEAYVDYVKGSPEAGIINNPDKYPKITKSLILELNEKDGEENISAGYHAIEFLLWGQDFNAGAAGARPNTDYSTRPNAKRRAAYLRACTELLVNNLAHLVEEWSPGHEDNYRAAFVRTPEESVWKILTGLSMLTGFEMASERLLVAWDSKLQEDEHSCFSDTTHNDIVYDLIGIENVWLGRYQGLNGNTLEGPGLEEIVKAKDAKLATQISEKIAKSILDGRAIPRPFDQAILGDDKAFGRKKILTTIETLEDQADLLVKAGKLLGHNVPIAEEES